MLNGINMRAKNFRFIKTTIQVLAVVTVARCLLIAQTLQVGGLSQAEISELFSKLTQHTASPDSLLDPRLATETKEKESQKLANPYYRLTLEQTAPATVKGDLASVPIRVHLEDRLKVFEADTSATLIRREGVWYFGSYDFLAFSTFQVVALFVALAAAVLYATMVLFLYKRLSEAGRIDVSVFLLTFVPLFWPYLFRKVRQRRRSPATV
jgi:hypothetical protein